MVDGVEIEEVAAEEVADTVEETVWKKLQQKNKHNYTQYDFKKSLSKGFFCT